jgi:hypothetical protein
MIGAFVGFLRIFLLGILIFKGLIARRLYKSFGILMVNQALIFLTDLKKTNKLCHKNLLKGIELFHAGGQTDVQKGMTKMIIPH